MITSGRSLYPRWYRNVVVWGMIFIFTCGFICGLVIGLEIWG